MKNGFSTAAVVLAGRLLPVWGVFSANGTAVVDTSLYEHYGPQTNTVSAPAVFLDGIDLCETPRVSVTGKIVVTGGSKTHSRCDIEQMYSNLNRAGAAAFVKSIWHLDPPGIQCFSHFSWDADFYRAKPMTMVEICHEGPNGPKFSVKGLDGKIVTLGPPHNTEYRDLFTSVYWMIGIQTLVPIACLWIAVVAVAESFRAYAMLRRDAHTSNLVRQEFRQIGIAICVMEGTSAFLLGIVHATGGSTGRTILIRHFYDYFWTRLCGLSIFTDFLLVLMMREQLRAAPPSTKPLRSVLKTYPWVIGLAGVVFFGVDILCGVLIQENLDKTTSGALLYGGFTVALILITALVGGYFFVNAYKLAVPLVHYYRTRKKVAPTLRNDHALRLTRNIRHIAMVLLINSAVLIWICLSVIYFSSMVARGLNNSTEVGIYAFNAVLARVSLSYWHIQIVRPASSSSSFEFVCKMLSSACIPALCSSTSAGSSQDDGGKAASPPGKKKNADVAKPKSSLDLSQNRNESSRRGSSMSESNEGHQNLPKTGGCFEEMASEVPVANSTEGNEESGSNLVAENSRDVTLEVQILGITI